MHFFFNKIKTQFLSTTNHLFMSPIFMTFMSYILFFSYQSSSLHIGAPTPWGINMQMPATPVMEGIRGFNSDLTVLFFVIGSAVLFSLLGIVARYREGSGFHTNPYVDDWSEHTLLEIVWTIGPTIILLFILIPSLGLLFAIEESIGDVYTTIHVVGRQWFWSYYYPSNLYSFSGKESLGLFQSFLQQKSRELTEGTLRNLTDGPSSTGVNEHFLTLFPETLFPENKDSSNAFESISPNNRFFDFNFPAVKDQIGFHTMEDLFFEYLRIVVLNNVQGLHSWRSDLINYDTQEQFLFNEISKLRTKQGLFTILLNDLEMAKSKGKDVSTINLESHENVYGDFSDDQGRFRQIRFNTWASLREAIYRSSLYDHILREHVLRLEGSLYVNTVQRHISHGAADSKTFKNFSLLRDAVSEMVKSRDKTMKPFGEISREDVNFLFLLGGFKSFGVPTFMVQDIGDDSITWNNIKGPHNSIKSIGDPYEDFTPVLNEHMTSLNDKRYPQYMYHIIGTGHAFDSSFYDQNPSNPHKLDSTLLIFNNIFVNFICHYIERQWILGGEENWNAHISSGKATDHELHLENLFQKLINHPFDPLKAYFKNVYHRINLSYDILSRKIGKSKTINVRLSNSVADYDKDQIKDWDAGNLVKFNGQRKDNHEIATKIFSRYLTATSVNFKHNLYRSYYSNLIDLFKEFYGDVPGSFGTPVAIGYDSYMLPPESINTSAGQFRNLSVDAPLVMPSHCSVKILVTGSDVIHSWAVPAAGIKMDAVPGRLNRIFVHFTKPGVYYGQCSEICGAAHALMPIQVVVLPRSVYELHTMENMLRACVNKSDFRFTRKSFGEDLQDEVQMKLKHLPTIFEIEKVYDERNLLLHRMFNEYLEYSEASAMYFFGPFGFTSFDGYLQNYHADVFDKKLFVDETKEGLVVYPSSRVRHDALVSYLFNDFNSKGDARVRDKFRLEFKPDFKSDVLILDSNKKAKALRYFNVG